MPNPVPTAGGIAWKQNAEQIFMGLAAPALTPAAQKIAAVMEQLVPVHHGGARKVTSVTVTPAAASAESFAGGEPEARVEMRSPFWHFFEYGTRYNAPSRPIARAVASTGLRFDAS